MAYVLRAIQKVAVDKWDEKLALEARFAAVEARSGVVAARTYRSFLGAEPYETFIKEFEFDSLAVLEGMMTKLEADGDRQALFAEDEREGITLEHRYEMYTLL